MKISLYKKTVWEIKIHSVTILIERDRLFRGNIIKFHVFKYKKFCILNCFLKMNLAVLPESS